MGHELSHQFDDVGAQFDENGNLVNWWSDKTRKNFKSKTECFVKQYEAIIDEDTGLCLNGTNTLGENISDNGGIKQAYLAFEAKSKTEKMQRLPMVEQYTPEQLFFLSYALSWCEKLRVQLKKKVIDSGGHLPGEYRINVPLANMEQFSTAFKCPLGSKMNPVEKCKLW